MMVAGSFLVGFIWSVSDGQYEDEFSPSVRILFEDNLKNSTHIKKSPKQQSKKCR
jgi:cbb3-type cytochrome oxidase maturation protein